MRTIFLLVTLIFAALFVSPMPIDETTERYELTVLQINAKWNENNALDIDRLTNCNIEWAFLEDQNKDIQDKFQKIPFIVIKKGNEPIVFWEGNIMFEPTVTLREIQSHINNH